MADEKTTAAAPPEPEPNSTPAPPPPARSRTATRLFSCTVLLGLIAFGGTKVPTLWDEWKALQREWAAGDESQIVGYMGIDPAISTAHRPKDWVHDEGDSTFIWAGWIPNVGHGWFRVGKGELKLDQLHGAGPLGKDGIRAIDYPLTENSRGERWQMLWSGTPVIGLELGKGEIAYPLLVLKKVEVINDTVGGVPVLVIHTPFVPDEKSVATYEPILDGKRVTLGLSGYFYEGHQLLYDRGTDSLWVATPENVIAVAGERKGATLKRLEQLKLTTWGDWRAKHPETPLLIGADRSKPKPVL
jgi:hypothetical protein